MSESFLYSAFEGSKLLASGRLDEVALKIRKRMEKDASASVLIFSDTTGKQMDLDLRGSESEVRERLKVFLSPDVKETSAGPGRPKLGVVAREVSLLPRHWEWLATQQGGASATLRRLIEDARKNPSSKDRLREAQECTHRFMTAIAGNLPHYEEALRALYTRDKKAFQSHLRDWPEDIRDHAKKLAAPTWS